MWIHVVFVFVLNSVIDVVITEDIYLTVEHGRSVVLCLQGNIAPTEIKLPKYAFEWAVEKGTSYTTVAHVNERGFATVNDTSGTYFMDWRHDFHIRNVRAITRIRCTYRDLDRSLPPNFVHYTIYPYTYGISTMKVLHYPANNRQTQDIPLNAKWLSSSMAGTIKYYCAFDNFLPSLRLEWIVSVDNTRIRVPAFTDKANLQSTSDYLITMDKVLELSKNNPVRLVVSCQPGCLLQEPGLVVKYGRQNPVSDLYVQFSNSEYNRAREQLGIRSNCGSLLPYTPIVLFIFLANVHFIY